MGPKSLQVDPREGVGPRPDAAPGPAAGVLRALGGHFGRAGPVLLALAAGLAAGFAQPPWGFLPGLLGYGLIFRLVDGAKGPAAARRACFRGWLSGCGYFLVSLWWIYEPFQVDADEQGWMAPLAVAVMVGGMALFWGAAALTYRRLARPGVLRALFFAGVFAAFEWIRGHLLTGFPWDLPGETWRAGSALSQTASYFGVYGLTWITLVGAAALMVEAEGRAGRRLALAAVAALVGLWGMGEARLRQAPPPASGAPVVRIVQPNIPQASKYDPAMFANILGAYVGLSDRAPSGRAPDVIVWPEGAIPDAFEDYLAPGTWTRDAITKALKPGQTLILGGYRFGRDAKGATVTFNSLAALRRVGEDLTIGGIYDKYRLVPFGEFIPLDGLARRLGIKQMVHVGDGFSPGPRPRPLALAGLPLVQPLICYEALYPGLTRQGALLSGHRASWIVNISNDAWFGAGSGPLQHLNMARYRAIEEGLPVIRATPTGVSAIIDPLGRVAPGKSLPEGGFGVIDGPLPGALPMTLYDRLGDFPFLLALVFSLIGAAWPFHKRPTS